LASGLSTKCNQFRNKQNHIVWNVVATIITTIVATAIVAMTTMNLCCTDSHNIKKQRLSRNHFSSISYWKPTQ
jgi:hypothetical protein